MKTFFACLVISFSLSLKAQNHKVAVVKTNGDSIWCEDAGISFSGSNKVKKVNCKGGSVSEVDGKDVAFIVYPNNTIIVGDDGMDYGDVEIYGTNYYFSGVSTDNGGSAFYVLDKNHKYVCVVQNADKAYVVLKKYFSDCPDFVTEIDKASKAHSKGLNSQKIMALVAKYKC